MVPKKDISVYLQSEFKEATDFDMFQPLEILKGKSIAHFCKYSQIIDLMQNQKSEKEKSLFEMYKGNIKAARLKELGLAREENVSILDFSGQSLLEELLNHSELPMRTLRFLLDDILCRQNQNSRTYSILTSILLDVLSDKGIALRDEYAPFLSGDAQCQLVSMTENDYYVQNAQYTYKLDFSPILLKEKLKRL